MSVLSACKCSGVQMDLVVPCLHATELTHLSAGRALDDERAGRTTWDTDNTGRTNGLRQHGTNSNGLRQHGRGTNELRQLQQRGELQTTERLDDQHKRRWMTEDRLTDWLFTQIRTRTAIFQRTNDKCATDTALCTYRLTRRAPISIAAAIESGARRGVRRLVTRVVRNHDVISVLQFVGCLQRSSFSCTLYNAVSGVTLSHSHWYLAVLVSSFM